MYKKVILNSGDGAWVFQALAKSLANSLQIDISSVPGDFNYVLGWNETNINTIASKMFIPWRGIKLASDKRLLANVFIKHKISIPDTFLIDTHREVLNFLRDTNEQWCLKYPIGCGASGHKKIS